jgi:hypothetical protein
MSDDQEGLSISSWRPIQLVIESKREIKYLCWYICIYRYILKWNLGVL